MDIQSATQVANQTSLAATRNTKAENTAEQDRAAEDSEIERREVERSETSRDVGRRVDIDA